jgi:hypothetical protein
MTIIPFRSSVKLWLPLLLHFATAVTIDDLFVVKGGTTDGGCDNQKATINQWLTDTQTLVDAGLKITDPSVYPTDNVARRNLQNFFGIQFTAGSMGAHTVDVVPKSTSPGADQIISVRGGCCTLVIRNLLLT